MKKKEEVSVGALNKPSNTKHVGVSGNKSFDDLYRILDRHIFEVMARMSNVDVNIESNDEDELVCYLTDREIIDDCINTNVIERFNANRACTLGSPDMLIKFITSVEQHVYSDDESEYHIFTSRGNIVIKSNDILDLQTWKLQVYNHCDIVLTCNMRQKGIRESMDTLLIYIKNTVVNTWQSVLSKNDIEADIIMSEVRKLSIVYDRDDFIGFTALREEDTFYVRSDTLKGIVEGLKYAFTSTQKVLKSYLLRPSKQINISTHRTSVWQFIPWMEC